MSICTSFLYNKKTFGLFYWILGSFPTKVGLFWCSLGTVPTYYYTLGTGNVNTLKIKKKKYAGKLLTLKLFKLFWTFFPFCCLQIVSPYVYLSTSGVILKGQLMKHISLLFYVFLFYTCVIAFLWNFNSFTFPEKIITFILISGIQCISGLISAKDEV